MIRGYSEYSNEELVDEFNRLNVLLEKAGGEFEMCNGTEYMEIDGVPYNLKEQLGCEIYGLYAAVGEITQIMKSKNIEYSW